MRRRDFIAAGLTVAGSVATRVGRAQMVKRAAVVIGVDRVPTFQPLSGAASGAKRVADWLSAEDFSVALLSDAAKPVTAGEIFSAIDGLIQRGTVQQLVVYFAGHGFVNQGTEYWLLSHAPRNTSEAVNLEASRSLAERVGIPSVAFISDACRLPASGLGLGAVRGSEIFPNEDHPPPVPCDIDLFLATRMGDAAWEIGQGPSDAHGVYTECLLGAFQRPYESMVRMANGQRVVPNVMLRDYLAKEVPKKVQAVKKSIVQVPDSKVLSPERIYMGRVLTTDRLAEPTGLLRPAPTLADVASAAIDIELSGSKTQKHTAAILTAAKSSGFDAARDEVIRARGIESQIRLRRGFVVVGANVKSVTVGHGGTASVVNSPQSVGSASAGVEVEFGSREAVTVVLEFADGTGTVLAGLQDFVGTVTVDGGRVINVSYTPSRGGPLWSEYQHEAKRLDRLRADVAAAARLGVLRFEGPRAERNSAANAFAQRIRMLKGIDPTLGLYAAYAYTEAGALDQVRSVDHYVRENLGADLYDIAMLSRKLNSPQVRGPYPFCPMLAQGWALLRAKGARLNDLVDAARDHMIPSLWTTFDSIGVELVRKAAMVQR